MRRLSLLPRALLLMAAAERSHESGSWDGLTSGCSLGSSVQVQVSGTARNIAW